MHNTTLDPSAVLCIVVLAVSMRLRIFSVEALLEQRLSRGIYKLLVVLYIGSLRHALLVPTAWEAPSTMHQLSQLVSACQFSSLGVA